MSVDGAHSLLDCLDYDETYVRRANLAFDLKLVVLTGVQTIGLPKRDRAKVFAMMSPAPVTELAALPGGAVSPNDPDFADVVTAARSGSVASRLTRQEYPYADRM